MGPELCKTLEIHLECMGVCVCMCGIALLKAKTFKAFAIYFLVYLLGQVKIGLNYFIFFKITCVTFTYVFCNSCNY